MSTPETRLINNGFIEMFNRLVYRAPPDKDPLDYRLAFRDVADCISHVSHKHSLLTELAYQLEKELDTCKDVTERKAVLMKYESVARPIAKDMHRLMDRVVRQFKQL